VLEARTIRPLADACGPESLALGQDLEGTANRTVAPHWRVFGNAATVGVLTLAAKLAGAAKVVVTARFFGTSDALDAFLIAFLLPSFVSDVVAGSLTPSLVPLLIQTRNEVGPSGGVEATHGLIRGALAFALTAMVAAAVGLGLTGRWLLPLAGSSFSPAKLDIATSLFFGLLFWLPMSGCIATWRAVLNANGRFALPAIAPVATPLVVMVLLYTFADRYGVVVLCAGTVGGVAVEFLLLALAVRRAGYPIRPGWKNWMSPQLGRLRRQYRSLAASAVIASACGLVDQSVAGRLGPGRVSALEYGGKLTTVLIAVVASAVATGALPTFSGLAAAQDWQALRRSVLIYSGAITLLLAPVTAALVSYSSGLVRVFLEHGAFHATAAQAVIEVQRFALLQAPFAVLLAIGAALTAALSANRLLVWMGVAALVTDIVLDIVFSRRWGVAGIALAGSAVQCVSLSVLILWLRHHEPQVFSGGA
jgi:putative peptidoglycan lipid II flippase